MKTIIFTERAIKQLDALPADVQDQVLDGLNRYAISGVGDVSALQAREGYRLRLGRYRVIFSEDGATILAIYVGKRETTTYRR